MRPKRIDNCLPTSFRQRLAKTGGRLIRHARCDWRMLAGGHLTRRLFRAMPGRIAAPPVPAGYGAAAGKLTGRRVEGDREVYEKPLEMSNFRLSRTPERQHWPLPRRLEPPGVETT